MPVHLYGQMADMASLVRLAKEAQLVLIEDACQAHGARRDGLAAGTVGAAAAFSFYPAKNVGAFGDAGALVTGTPSIDAAARRLRTHGQAHKNHHVDIGYTARLDSIQAIVLLRKLPAARRANASRVAAAARYSAELAGVGDLVTPQTMRGSDPAWHLYVVRNAPTPTRWRGRSPKRGSVSVCTIPLHPTWHPPTPTWTVHGDRFRWRRGSATRCCHCPSSPASPTPRSIWAVGAIKRFFDA